MGGGAPFIPDGFESDPLRMDYGTIEQVVKKGEHKLEQHEPNNSAPSYLARAVEYVKNYFK